MIFEPGGDPVEVQWYFADDPQPWLPQGNQFVSANWVSRDTEAGDLGEQPGPRVWANGADVKGYPVQVGDGCVLDADFVTGLSPGDTTGPWDSQSKLACCVESCFNVPDNLTVTLTDTGSCAVATGSFGISRFSMADPCHWIGNVTMFGVVSLSLFWDSPGWRMVINCVSSPITATASGAIGDYGTLVFHFTETTEFCCGPAGPGTFDVAVT